MQLTKTEILNTQIIVTTPEKWDVVTRKATGDTELSQVSCRMFIFTTALTLNIFMSIESASFNS
jgi:hypothetical protein